MKRRDGSLRKVRIFCRSLLERDERSILLVCIDDISELFKAGVQ